MIKINKDYYVYGYVRLDTNTYFYIGKGKGIRYKRVTIRSDQFKEIVNNVPCAVEIIYDNLTEEQALKLERDTIENLVYNEGYSMGFDNDFSDCGNLLNRTYGDLGISGYRYTDEQRQKCARNGEENGIYGKKGELSPHYGKVYSEDHKEKIKMNNPNRKGCYCVELKRYFNSFREAERILSDEYAIICSHASISAVCSGRNEHCGRDAITDQDLHLHFIKV